MRRCVPILASLLTLTACSGSGSPNAQRSASGEEVADRLEKAADQSAPAARKVLDDAADEARQHATLAPVDQPGSFAQEAMGRAGKAEASATPESSPKH